MSAFVSVVSTALLTSILLVFPSSALFIFVVLPSPRLSSLGQFKGDALSLYSFIGYIEHEPEVWMAHRVALYLGFLFLLVSHCFRSSLSLG